MWIKAYTSRRNNFFTSPTGGNNVPPQKRDFLFGNSVATTFFGEHRFFGHAVCGFIKLEE
jgi:hypothetical protein